MVGPRRNIDTPQGSDGGEIKPEKTKEVDITQYQQYLREIGEAPTEAEMQAVNPQAESNEGPEALTPAPKNWEEKGGANLERQKALGAFDETNVADVATFDKTSQLSPDALFVQEQQREIAEIMGPIEDLLEDDSLDSEAAANAIDGELAGQWQKASGNPDDVKMFIGKLSEIKRKLEKASKIGGGDSGTATFDTRTVKAMLAVNNYLQEAQRDLVDSIKG